MKNLLMPVMIILVTILFFSVGVMLVSKTSEKTNEMNRPRDLKTAEVTTMTYNRESDDRYMTVGLTEGPSIIVHSDKLKQSEMEKILGLNPTDIITYGYDGNGYIRIVKIERGLRNAG